MTARRNRHRDSVIHLCRDAVTVFSDPLALFVEDETRPENARLIGQSITARVLLVVFVERDGDVTRLISARRATRHERRRYEEGQ